MFRLASCALALIVVLASVILPTCGGICCPKTADASIHAQMPCCAGESSMASREASPAHPATFAPRATAPVAVVALPCDVPPAPRIQRTELVADRTPHEPAPPLFLLNAQFLI
ncbi:MAG TPA: hypothetical protein VEK11_18310 [Thermoanaerobaculia bacterium]|nr:hypothetical protein [Thermoanaerobaculia bacterium]